MFSFFRNVSSDVAINSAKEVIPRHMSNDLESLILYGSHASPESVSNERDPIQLLIVLSQTDPSTLDRLSEAFKKITGKTRLSPMVLTIEELKSSTDVFPITFLEMKRQHRLLAGKDVLSDLTIQMGHLRLRCEQEIKNLLFRMQHSYLINHDRPKNLQIMLRRNYQSFARTIGAALMISNNDIPTDHAELFNAASQQFGLDQDVLDRVAQAYSGRLVLDRDSLLSLYGAFMEIVGHAAICIDKLPEEVALVEVFEDAGE